MVDGTFDEVAVRQPLEGPAPGGGTKLIDAAWVSRASDRTAARVRYRDIRPAN